MCKNQQDSSDGELLKGTRLKFELPRNCHAFYFTCAYSLQSHMYISIYISLIWYKYIYYIIIVNSYYLTIQLWFCQNLSEVCEVYFVCVVFFVCVVYCVCVFCMCSLFCMFSMFWGKIKECFIKMVLQWSIIRFSNTFSQTRFYMICNYECIIVLTYE